MARILLVVGQYHLTIPMHSAITSNIMNDVHFR